jgi:hypothetical protein
LKPHPRNSIETFCVEGVGVIVGNLSNFARSSGRSWPEDEPSPVWMNSVALLVWLAAGAVAFLPFAFNTSPWDAVTLRVPGNQGNWWHFLAGAPAFLAFPMIWFRLRAFFGERHSTTAARRVIWIVVGLSVCGTTLVELPFLMHLAGTSDWQRFAVLGLGFGVMIASGVALIVLRRRIAPTRACIAGLDTAYLANMALILVVYAGAPGTFSSRSGWFVAMVIVWPVALELAGVFARTFRGTTPVEGGLGA